MAEYVTYFDAEEGVNRANFNSRIEQINAEFDSRDSQKGAVNGIATLDENGKLVQMPSAADVGAAEASHNQAASTITAGTFPATGIKAATGTDYTTYRIRNIAANTSAMTAKSTALTNGNIYLQYE